MKPLHVALTCARDGGPLVVVDGLPGDDAELRPHQLRALSAVLAKLADDAEARKLAHRGKPLPPDRRVYPVT